MKIALLKGGINGEREVSLRSAENVENALRSLNTEFESIDLRDMNNALFDKLQHFDLVLPILHGEYYEDGELQQHLQERGIRYLGADAAASKLCFDKLDFKAEIAKSGISVPQGGMMDLESFRNMPLKESLVIKPNDSGSSLDLFVIKDPNDYIKQEQKIVRSFKEHGRLLVEEYIDGIECTVAILSDDALGVVEIIPPEGEIFDFNNKYNGKTAENCPPKYLSDEMQEFVMKQAVAAHKAAGVRHLSRVDLIVPDDGKAVVLELNTLPGMTEESLYPKAAKQAGYSMPALMQKLISLAK